ncbi:MAG: hypothetical protein M0P92_06490 [Acholeplasmataceae bacterium]|nr:hypothetical protein [Acholeplasmataceae bacterium]
MDSQNVLNEIEKRAKSRGLAISEYLSLLVNMEDCYVNLQKEAKETTDTLLKQIKMQEATIKNQQAKTKRLQK